MLTLRRTLSVTVLRGDVRTKIKFLEPKAYGGTRSAKKLESFLWDMEQYFQATRVLDEEKVTITTINLNDDAKVWWRTRFMVAESVGLPKIETWDMFKNKLKCQFLPSNSSWVSRDGCGG